MAGGFCKLLSTARLQYAMVNNQKGPIRELRCLLIHQDNLTSARISCALLRDQERSSALTIPLSELAMLQYARCFKYQTKTRNLPSTLATNEDPGLILMHNRIIALRDKVLAHGDDVSYKILLVKKKIGDQTRRIPFVLGDTAWLPPRDLDQVNQLIENALTAINPRIEKLIARLAPISDSRDSVAI